MEPFTGSNIKAKNVSSFIAFIPKSFYEYNQRKLFVETQIQSSIYFQQWNQHNRGTNPLIFQSNKILSTKRSSVNKNTLLVNK